MLRKYILKRLILIVPTLFIIMLLNFAVIQIVPGGPIDTVKAKYEEQIQKTNKNLAKKDLDPEFIQALNKQFDFDKPWYYRFFKMLKNYLLLDFGDSFFKDTSVLSLIASTLPVSITLGFWATLMAYLISIPLGIKKAVKQDSLFDISTSFIIAILYAIPSFLIAIVGIFIFASGGIFEILPIKGLVSDNFSSLTISKKILDYLKHMILPVASIMLGSLAYLVVFTKNNISDEIGKAYVIVAKAKGLPESYILYRHVLKNAIIFIIISLPSTFIGIIFTSSLLVEIIFSLKGLGNMVYEATLERDYPVIFAVLYISTLVGLLVNVLQDALYAILIPTVTFEKNKT